MCRMWMFDLIMIVFGLSPPLLPPHPSIQSEHKWRMYSWPWVILMEAAQWATALKRGWSRHSLVAAILRMVMLTFLYQAWDRSMVVTAPGCFAELGAVLPANLPTNICWWIHGSVIVGEAKKNPKHHNYTYASSTHNDRKVLSIIRQEKKKKNNTKLKTQTKSLPLSVSPGEDEINLPVFSKPPNKLLKSKDDLSENPSFISKDIISLNSLYLWVLEEEN